jgi:hypothetical protein
MTAKPLSSSKPARASTGSAAGRARCPSRAASITSSARGKKPAPCPPRDAASMHVSSGRMRRAIPSPGRNQRSKATPKAPSHAPNPSIRTSPTSKPTSGCIAKASCARPTKARQAKIELYLQWAANARALNGATFHSPPSPRPRHARCKLATIHLQPKDGKNPSDKPPQFAPLIAEAAKQKADLVVLRRNPHLFWYRQEDG